MQDGTRATRRWAAGAASLGLVALALVVGLLLAGEERDGAAPPVAATATTAAGSDERPGGGERTAVVDDDDGSCAAADRTCGSRSGRDTGDDPGEAGSTDPVVASTGAPAADLSPQEEGREAIDAEPNVDPDHYGPGGEPDSEPVGPTAEGAREATGTPPNRNPDHQRQQR